MDTLKIFGRRFIYLYPVQTLIIKDHQMTKRFATFAAIILAFYIPLTFISNAHFPFSDGAEHGAAVRGLAENPTHPEDPMLTGYPGKSARYVPSIYLMGLTMRAFQLLSKKIFRLKKL